MKTRSLYFACGFYSTPEIWLGLKITCTNKNVFFYTWTYKSAYWVPTQSHLKQTRHNHFSFIFLFTKVLAGEMKFCYAGNWNVKLWAKCLYCNRWTSCIGRFSTSLVTWHDDSFVCSVYIDTRLGDQIEEKCQFCWTKLYIILSTLFLNAIALRLLVYGSMIVSMPKIMVWLHESF